MSEQLFDGTAHSDLYSKYRTVLPEKIKLIVLNYLNKQLSSDKWDIAVDVGCGNGQGTNLLAKHFNKVYGYDVSGSQIEMAKKLQHPTNVYYEVSPAESLPLENNSVQLITAFAAAHWFNLDKFFIEVNRVLIPNGVVALCSYMFPTTANDNIIDKEILNLLYNDFLHHELLSQYTDKRIDDLAKNHYKDVKFPQNFNSIYIDDMIIPEKYCGQTFLGFLKSTSPYQKCLRENPKAGEQLINEVELKLRKILNNDFETELITFNFPYFILMGYKIE